MKSFAFTLVTFILIAALCTGGYYAFRSMTKPASYIPEKTEKIGDIYNVSTDPETKTTQSVPTNPAPQAPAAMPAPAATTASQSNSTLSGEITALIASKATFKIGSKGEGVKTVQGFMNLYFKKNATPDGVYGKTLAANVSTFQKQNKVTVTGSVGPATLQMMSLWLKNHSQ